jgi:hypothetical protein
LPDDSGDADSVPRFRALHVRRRLKSLESKGETHTILLVSHQEEFADAFPDGYRFALTDGATTVTRFAR